MRISDWSPDVCSSDLGDLPAGCSGPQRPAGGSPMHGSSIDAVLIHIDSTGQAALGVVLALIMFGVALDLRIGDFAAVLRRPLAPLRSEEHTSELQSLMRSSYAVFCWKKKKNKDTSIQ